MSYLVLARKWRPKDFSTVVGQEHVLKALINALDNDRLHHAFLFSGMRGVGKTTLARILAKCINCEAGVSSKPCGECSTCQEIDEGRFVDLIEVDAASRTRVDDTRELLDNVQYSPTRGRYKVYLIDEVHMLSTHSFNALLKTLEEPPPHVKFLLATTDPQKLPVTVLSRCLQFNLRRLSTGLIRGHLAHLVEAESIEAETGALNALARAADGSMRDALSLLDQAIAYGGGTLGASDINEMLGSVDQTHVSQLLQALAHQDGAGMLAVVDEIQSRGIDFDAVIGELSAMLQQIALAQVVPESLADRVEDAQSISTLAGQFAPDDVQLYYQIAITGSRDLPLAPDPRSGFEMVLLRMLAFSPAGAGDAGGGKRVATPAVGTSPSADSTAAAASTLATQGSGIPSVAHEDAPVISHAVSAQSAARASDAATTSKPPRQATPAPRAQTANAPTGASSTAAAAAPAAAPTGANTAAPSLPPGDPGALAWHQQVDAMGLQGAVRQLAANCLLQKREGSTVYLLLDDTQQHALTDNLRGRLQDAMCKHYEEQVSLRVVPGALEAETIARRDVREAAARLQGAHDALAADPNVRALQDMLGARINTQSIEPL